MGIPNHLTCFLRNLYAGQEATVRTELGTMDWFQIGKGVLSSCFFNLYAEYTWNTGLFDSQGGIKTARRNINNLRYSDDTTLMAGSEEQLKSLLMKVKGEWKSWLNLTFKIKDHGIWSHHFMANRWGKNGKCQISLRMVKEATKLKKTLAPWKKSYNKPRQRIKKQRHHFADKCLYSQTYGFSSRHVWMWDLGHKKAEQWRIDAFEMQCWIRLFRVSSKSKEIKPINPKGNQPWIFIGRTGAEAPILWPLLERS